MNRVGIAIFMLILLLPLIANAQLCQILFGQQNPFIHSLYPLISSNAVAISNPSTYANLLDFSLVIILLVMAAIGIVYAIGYSMKINKLLAYSRTELLESVFNVIIIVAIAGSMAIVYSGMTFITNIESAILSGAGISGISTPQVFTSPQDIYIAICNNYFGAGWGLVNQFFALYGLSILLQTLANFQIMLMPNYGGFIMLTPGVTLYPLAGLTPLMLVISNILKIAVALVALDVGVPMILFFIYYLFPFFLYAGVLFRSFPWTRAAGGTMLALFISFYIVFPALLYPLSNVQSSGSSTSSMSSNALTLSTNSWSSAGGTFLSLGSELANLVGGLSNVALQIGSLIVSLIISYDLVEMLGKLLGAPSASGTNLLRKVI